MVFSSLARHRHWVDGAKSAYRYGALDTARPHQLKDGNVRMRKRTAFHAN